jgi:hypothetical protein
MFFKAIFHHENLYGTDEDRSRRPQKCSRTRTDELSRKTELLLPGALLVAIQAQLLAPFMLVDFCLAAFFD